MNNEFGVLEALLCQLPGCLNPGGRVGILTFHSGEDRRVKRAFAEGLHQGVYEAVSVRFRSPHGPFTGPSAHDRRRDWKTGSNTLNSKTLTGRKAR